MIHDTSRLSDHFHQQDNSRSSSFAAYDTASVRPHRHIAISFLARRAKCFGRFSIVTLELDFNYIFIIVILWMHSADLQVLSLVIFCNIANYFLFLARYVPNAAKRSI